MSTEFMLSIQDPPRYDAVIDTKLENSIFHDMYCGAINNVKDIMGRSKQILDADARDPITPTAENSTINTAIAFVGGRGTGKSSAMQSFRAFLHEPPIKRKDNNPGDEFDVGDKTFFALSTIDSSQISEKETVIGRMSASMLEEFENCQKHLSVEEKQNFMRCAKEVNELSVMIHDGEWFRCGDKLLSDTRKICNMRNIVCKLVELYLKIVKRSYLVVAIDDLDMGIQNAHSIMEEIRQYLSIPRVIVLVSVDENLLDAVMNATITKSLKSNEHKPLVKDLSYRYLEKMFPANRRHYTPTLNAKQLREWKADFYKNQDGGERLVIRDALLQLIWRKTMMLSVCNRDEDHLLIPRNLRSLYNMVVLLRNMPDVAYKNGTSNLRTRTDFAKEDAMKIREQLRHNLKVFGQYIVANIASYGMPRVNGESELGMVEVLESVIRKVMEVPLTHMNAMIVGDILYYVSNINNPHDTYKLVFDNSVKQNSKFDLLSPAVRYPEAISLGDVMFVLGKLDSRSKCMYIRYLVEVIRTLWSVRMTEELYVNYVNGLDSKDIKTTEAFRRVVGGFIANPDYVDEFLENGGWIKFDDIFEPVGFEIAKYMSVYQGASDPTKTTWRESRRGGRAYYHIEAHSKEKDIWCHPFTIYSYLLRVPLNDHDMVLPLFSFDFIYRYYEELRQSFRSESHLLTFFEIWKKLKEEHYRILKMVFDMTRIPHNITDVMDVVDVWGELTQILMLQKPLEKVKRTLISALDNLIKSTDQHNANESKNTTGKSKTTCSDEASKVIQHVYNYNACCILTSENKEIKDKNVDALTNTSDYKKVLDAAQELKRWVIGEECTGSSSNKNE